MVPNLDLHSVLSSPLRGKSEHVGAHQESVGARQESVGAHQESIGTQRESVGACWESVGARWESVYPICTSSIESRKLPSAE